MKERPSLAQMIVGIPAPGPRACRSTRPATIEEARSDEDRKPIEKLLRQARNGWAKTYDLNRMLDRFNLYREWEDHFLDPFKKLR